MMHKRIENGTHTIESKLLRFFDFMPVQNICFKFNEFHATKFVGSLCLATSAIIICSEYIVAFGGKMVLQNIKCMEYNNLLICNSRCVTFSFWKLKTENIFWDFDFSWKTGKVYENVNHWCCLLILRI